MHVIIYLNEIFGIFMKTKEEIAKKADLDLIISDDIYYIRKFLKNSTVPIDPTTAAPYELSNSNQQGEYSIQKHLPKLLEEGQNKSIYVNDDGHWVGLYYQADEQKLYFIDPLGYRYNQYSKINNQLIKLQETYPDIKIENLYTQKIQFAEVDVKNCGRFVGMTLVLLDHGTKPEEFQRLDSPIKITTARMTNASLALAAEIDQTLFSESNKNGLSDLRTKLAPIRLKKALKEYMTVVNDEVKKNIIENTNDIIYKLAETDEQQAKKLIIGLQNFTESPDQLNAQTLENIMQEQYSNLPNDIDKDGFSKTEMEQAIQASLKSANSEEKTGSLKEKVYTCIESLRLFINTIGTSITNRFKPSPEKVPQSKAR